MKILILVILLFSHALANDECLDPANLPCSFNLEKVISDNKVFHNKSGAEQNIKQACLSFKDHLENKHQENFIFGLLEMKDTSMKKLLT